MLHYSEIVARFGGRCGVCGGVYRKGARIAWREHGWVIRGQFRLNNGAHLACGARNAAHAEELSARMNTWIARNWK